MIRVKIIRDCFGVEMYEVSKLCKNLPQAADAAMMLSTQKPAEAFEPEKPAGWYPQDSGKAEPPPNCDGISAGEYRAQVQFEAAESGPDGRSCASGVCGMGD